MANYALIAIGWRLWTFPFNRCFKAADTKRLCSFLLLDTFFVSSNRTKIRSPSEIRFDFLCPFFITSSFSLSFRCKLDTKCSQNRNLLFCSNFKQTTQNWTPNLTVEMCIFWVHVLLFYSDSCGRNGPGISPLESFRRPFEWESGKFVPLLLM